MTQQEAKELIESIEVCDDEEMQEAHRIAIEALEKMIPKKPVEDFIFYRCPVCDNFVTCDGIIQEKYCKACGQAIDCSDVE